MDKVFSRPRSIKDTLMHYCPGCTHGIVHRLIAEAVEDMGLEDTTIGIAPVGCAVFAYNYLDFDFIQAAHGRAPAVATGVKRVLPEHTVFTYQGDGDLAAIGTAEIVHAAMRGENITVIFVNNAIYGMTGGQMAPTTLVGQRSTTCQKGREAKVSGYPIRVSEMLSQLDGACYIERVACDTPAHVRAAGKAIRKAFSAQVEERGFSMVEVVATCSTNWGMNPQEALVWLKENMLPAYPLGVYKSWKDAGS
ncbi:MAG: thiamine pyrophosphate-dependent enzyme [Bacillota bacterium]|jgi:2-oxoglutarate ferredoxin oxidoreductase subunit beta